ncbi:vacuolar membrane-associated protein iml1 [Arachnomyces sp. PD_36]|nr:vacuolar membrane-associated protein iml1 [Arachnomyces sp. PD_36]
MPPRGPTRGSHLRQVSSASVETTSTGRSTINSHYGSKPKTRSESAYRHSSVALNDRPCELWVHDESFSREEILFNSQAFSETGVKVGDLVEITLSPGSGDPSCSSNKLDPHGRPPYGHVGGEDGMPHTQPPSGIKINTTEMRGSPCHPRCLFLVKPFPAELSSRHPNLEISITGNVANIFGFKNRCQVYLSVIDRSKYSASHVEISFRDQFLARADMWRLVMSELVERPIYKGQKITFMGSIKATIRSVRVDGEKAVSGYFSPQTKPVFRSESARYVLFIQMSREMWDFDSEGTGDILFSRVINGFLPELFKRWATIDAKHLVTLVLFTRVEYEQPKNSHNQSMLNDESLKQGSSGNGPTSTQDFYRVVINDMASGYWTTILDELKREFRTFLRDVSIQKADPHEAFVAPGETPRSPSLDTRPATIAGHPSSAFRGNILEAINIASSQLAMDNIDRDMVRTGTSIVVITPGTGVFEVNYDALAWTSELLTSNGIGIDLVCLSPMPLHSTPLFKYRKPKDGLSRTSTVSKDSHLRNSPPPLRPGSGSYSSRLSHLSKSTTHYGSMPHSLAKFRPGFDDSDWGYGIPHWVDISFWNASAYQERRKILDKQSNVPIPWTISRQSKLFMPRVRMYEIQMMGVMESEQSNISIPYLSESNTGFGDVSNHLAHFPNISDTDSHTSRFLNTPNSPHKSQFSDGGKPESFLLGFKNSRRSALSARAKQQGRMLDWMDEYDSTVFRPFRKEQTQPKQPKGRRLVDSDGAFSRVQSRRSLSLKGRENYADEKADLASSASTRATTKQVQHLQPPDPKPPVQTGLKVPEKTSMKPPRPSIPRISRSISFALRGLGAAPPRAVASTEINVEHAVSDPALNRKTSGGTTSDSGKGSDSTDAKDTTLPPPELEKMPEKTAPKKASPNSEVTPSRPISIKIAQRKMLEEADAEAHRTEGSFSTTATDMGLEREPAGDSHGIFAMKRMGPRPAKPTEPDHQESSTSHSPSQALAPWIRSVNPSNELKDNPTQIHRFGRWQHVHPRKPNSASVKWKSLKTPAILPLTMEEFPTPSELASDYYQTPYQVFQNDDPDIPEAPKTREVLVREMVALRLSHGFQIVVGPAAAAAAGKNPHSRSFNNIFDIRQLSKDGTTIFMSLGNIIHKIVCVSGGEVEVTKFRRKALADSLPDKGSLPVPYAPAIRTILSKRYNINSLNIRAPTEEYNWNSADAYIAGHRDHLTDPPKQLRFWRIRFVLIPVRLPANMRRPMQSFHEDNEEEIHLLGITQLTSLWQRHKYVPTEEKRLQSAANKKKDQNPLDIMYQTRNPTEVVAAELDRLLLADPGQNNPAQLLPENELLQRSNLSISSLAQIIQGEKGVRMMDRRWHWRLHYNCFIGIELTTWLLRNFRDIDTREEAVELGNELMDHGLFQHVERRHNFRDGNYFYQISSDYRVPRQESKSSWFPARKSDKSVPSTPMDDSSKGSPSGRAKPDKSIDESDTSDLSTSRKTSKSKVAISLSKSLKYDLDPRKRSNRPEVVDLHYDRLHNPDNCFHIELSWMNATPKLIEDAIGSWAATAEKFGLKLVEVPINEASTVTQTQGFRKPYLVRLKLDPPSGPIPLEFGASSFSQHGNRDPYYYQKAILKKFDFVLDFEAWASFPPDVDVSYSWGKPEYHYPQYIHRSGCIIAQIMDNGNFLLLANRLSSHRSPVKDPSRVDRMDQGPGRPRAGTFDPLDRASPYLSPFTRPITDASSSTHPHLESTTTYNSPELIKDQLEAFCTDADKLQKLYSEGPAKTASFKATPNVPSTESSIPSLELPDSVVVRHISPPPNLDHRLSSSIESRMQNRGSPRNVLGPTP